jgi:hypothetical protein
MIFPAHSPSRLARLSRGLPAHSILVRSHESRSNSSVGGADLPICGRPAAFSPCRSLRRRSSAQTTPARRPAPPNAPLPRAFHTAVWTGSEMIVWGGFGYEGYLNTGGRYNASTHTWTAISTTNAPSVRWRHTAVWTGSEMIVWGGYNGSNVLNTGGRYNPSTDTWTAISMTNAPSARELQAAVPLQRKTKPARFIDRVHFGSTLLKLGCPVQKRLLLETLRWLRVTPSLLHHHDVKILVHINPKSDIPTDPSFGGIDVGFATIKLAAAFLE